MTRAVGWAVWALAVKLDRIGKKRKGEWLVGSWMCTGGISESISLEGDTYRV